MTKVQLKSKLIEKIESIEDIALIEELIGVVTIETEDIYQFDEKQIQKIKLAQLQIEKGDYLTNEEVSNQVDKWLAK